MLSLPLSLLADAGIQKVLTLTTFFIFDAVLVDEGREDPNTTKAGRHRPASETPFDGLGSSREHKLENSLNFRGIAMGLYRGWWGWGWGLCLPWICVCIRIVPLCVFVEFLCLSVYQSVCLSKSICICLSVCMSLFLPSLSPSLSLSLSLSICGVDLADQGS